MIGKVVAACAAGLLSGCAAPPPAAGDGLVRLGQTARFGRLLVTPVAVIEDSRCPQAVRCVWIGRVRIEAAVAGVTTEMTLGQPLPVANGALMLAEVLPARQPDTEIAPAAYRFRFSFTA